MTVWHWVRHGPTHEKAFVGWRDVPADLSDKAAISRLDAALPKPALLVSSDLVRASSTADAIAEGRTRLPSRFDLREFNFGAWDGLTFDVVAKRYPVLSRRYWEEPGDVAPPEGESWNEATRRVSRAVAAVNKQHPNAEIIAVAHFGAILSQVAIALGDDPYKALGHKIDNLSITTLQFDQSWSIERINHVP